MHSSSRQCSLSLSLNATCAEAMEKAFEDVDFKNPIIPVVANVTAMAEEKGDTFKSLLVHQVTGQVRWRETMGFMVAAGLKPFMNWVWKVLSVFSSVV